MNANKLLIFFLMIFGCHVTSLGQGKVESEIQELKLKHFIRASNPGRQQAFRRKLKVHHASLKIHMRITVESILDSASTAPLVDSTETEFHLRFTNGRKWKIPDEIPEYSHDYLKRIGSKNYDWENNPEDNDFLIYVLLMNQDKFTTIQIIQRMAVTDTISLSDGSQYLVSVSHDFDSLGNRTSDRRVIKLE